RPGRGADRASRGRRAERARDGRPVRPAAGERQGRLTCPADVEGLRQLRQEACVRTSPLALDGGDEAALQPEPPARPRAAEGRADARLRLHPLPQGRQGAKSGLATRRRALELARGALAALEASRQRLDDLNVFPVPDGDTGTNLLLTVGAVVDSLERARTDARGALADEVADAAPRATPASSSRRRSGAPPGCYAAPTIPSRRCGRRATRRTRRCASRGKGRC